MDATKVKEMNKLTNDVNKVAMRHGYQAEFSGFSEGKDVEFKMTVGFKKPVAGSAAAGDLFDKGAA